MRTHKSVLHAYGPQAAIFTPPFGLCKVIIFICGHRGAHSIASCFLPLPHGHPKVHFRPNWAEKNPQTAQVPANNSTKATTHPSPLDIPEVLEQLLSYLDHTAITLSVQHVCRQWRVVSCRVYCHLLVFDDYTTRQRTFEQVLEKLPVDGRFQWTSISLYGATGWIEFQKVLRRMDDDYQRIRVNLRHFHIIGSLKPIRSTYTILYMSALTFCTSTLLPP